MGLLKDMERSFGMPDPFMRAAPFPASRRWPSRTTRWAPQCSLQDSGNMYTLDADIPGALMENIRITVQVCGSLLVLSGHDLRKQLKLYNVDGYLLLMKIFCLGSNLFFQNGTVCVDAWGRGFNIYMDKPCFTMTYYLNYPVDLTNSTAGICDSRT